VRDEIRLGSGDYIDLKLYEPHMRRLLDTYIQADPSEKISSFEGLTLVQLIAEKGDKAIDSLPKSIKESPEAVAETIENNVRKVISDEMGVNPKYYEEMSRVLDALIQLRKRDAKNYKEYLRKILELTKQVANPAENASYPPSINTKPLQALYDNLGKNEAAAMKVDKAIRNSTLADWRGHHLKERKVLVAIRHALGSGDVEAAQILEIARRQHEY
jgi:type I restriction enzyme R subunit